MRSSSPDSATMETMVESLCTLYTTRAFIAQQELRAKVEVFEKSLLPSVAARQREADYAALEHSCALLDLDAQIACLELRLGIGVYGTDR